MGGRFGNAGATHVAGLARVGGARARAGQRGFTLLELLITLSVTTIGLVGLVALHLSIARGNDGASRSAEAQQITVNRLESLRAQRLGDLMQALTGDSRARPPAAPATTPPVTFTVAGRANMTYTVTATATTLSSVSSSLVKIRVVTIWAEDGGTPGVNPALDHSLALEVIRTREESP
jgi:prepilin-type N-terminal cleavage/methylation domain-containing protein